MSWRIVNITNICKMELKNNNLFIRYNDSHCIVSIAELGTLVIENTGVSITASLIAELVKNNVNVIFCDEKRNPLCTVNALYGSHNSSEKIRNQISWTKENKDKVWRLIVREKIKNQSYLLEKQGKSESAMLNDYIDEVEDGDITNREGFAAKVYFGALFGKQFSRNSDNSINVALNYGYGIILSKVSRVVVSNGVITQIGIHHDNMFNHYNLACDLMEPYRILIDKKVVDMKVDEFGKEQKRELIQVLNEEVLIEDKRQTVSNAIEIYVRSVLNAVSSGEMNIIRNYSFL